MKKIEIFDPAMCCPTGVCGPSIDKELLRMATLIDTLKKTGVDVQRYNLSSDPQVFVQNKKIAQLLQQEGVGVLPVTVVDGEIAVKGKYPSTRQLSEWTGKDLSMLTVAPVSGKNSGCGQVSCGCGNDENKDCGCC